MFQRVVVGIIMLFAFSISLAEALTSTDVSAKIKAIASKSPCSKHDWKNRGQAPSQYVAGMGLVYARSLCRISDADVTMASGEVEASNTLKDGLAEYAKEFKDANMANDTPQNILRHNYVLLTGLGMRESSGKYCEGRDVSQCFVKAESAEAGLFQTSYGAHTPIVEYLNKQYGEGKRQCLKDDFGGSNITCKIHISQNKSCPSVNSDITGTGPGADWQRMTKSCPAYAAEYAAVVIRKNGGAKGEFNPIRKHQAEVLPACDSMFAEIQQFIESHPDACAGF
jgi:hypothetical protein